MADKPAFFWWLKAVEPSRRNERMSRIARDLFHRGERVDHIKRAFRLLSQKCYVRVKRLSEAEITQWTSRKSENSLQTKMVLDGSSLFAQSTSFQSTSDLQCNEEDDEVIVVGGFKKEQFKDICQSQDHETKKESEKDCTIKICQNNKRKSYSDSDESECKNKKIKYTSYDVSGSGNKLIIRKADSLSEDIRKESIHNELLSNENVIQEKGQNVKDLSKESKTNNDHLIKKDYICKLANREEVKDCLNFSSGEAVHHKSNSEKDCHTSKNVDSCNQSSSNKKFGHDHCSKKKSSKSKKSKKSKEKRESSSKTKNKDDRKEKDNRKNKDKKRQSGRSEKSKTSSNNVDISSCNWDNRVFGIANHNKNNSLTQNNNHSLTPSLSNSTQIRNSYNKGEVQANCSSRDPTQIFGIPTSTKNSDESNRNYNVNFLGNTGKLRVKDPLSLGIHNANLPSNALKTASSPLLLSSVAHSSSESPISETLPSKSHSNDQNESGLVFQSNERMLIPKNNYFSGHIEVDKIMNAKVVFSCEHHVSKIAKLSEILHLAISDSIKKDVSIENAKILQSKELADKEITRAEKDYKYIMRVRAMEFCPLLFCLIRKQGLNHNVESVLVLFCQLVDSLLKIKYDNIQYFYRIKGIVLLFFEMGRFKDILISNVLGMEFEPFYNLLNFVCKKLSLQNFKTVTVVDIEIDGSEKCESSMNSNNNNKAKGILVRSVDSSPNVVKLPECTKASVSQPSHITNQTNETTCQIINSKISCSNKSEVISSSIKRITVQTAKIAQSVVIPDSNTGTKVLESSKNVNESDASTVTCSGNSLVSTTAPKCYPPKVVVPKRKSSNDSPVVGAMKRKIEDKPKATSTLPNHAAQASSVTCLNKNNVNDINSSRSKFLETSNVNTSMTISPESTQTTPSIEQVHGVSANLAPNTSVKSLDNTSKNQSPVSLNLIPNEISAVVTSNANSLMLDTSRSEINESSTAEPSSNSTRSRYSLAFKPVTTVSNSANEVLKTSCNNVISSLNAGSNPKSVFTTNANSVIKSSGNNTELVSSNEPGILKRNSSKFMPAGPISRSTNATEESIPSTFRNISSANNINSSVQNRCVVSVASHPLYVVSVSNNVTADNNVVKSNISGANVVSKPSTSVTPISSDKSLAHDDKSPLNSPTPKEATTLVNNSINESPCSFPAITSVREINTSTVSDRIITDKNSIQENFMYVAPKVVKKVPMITVKKVEQINSEVDSLKNISINKNVSGEILNNSINSVVRINDETTNNKCTNISATESTSSFSKSNGNGFSQNTDSIPPKPKLIPIDNKAMQKNCSAKKSTDNQTNSFNEGLTKRLSEKIPSIDKSTKVIHNKASEVTESIVENPVCQSTAVGSFQPSSSHCDSENTVSNSLSEVFGSSDSIHSVKNRNVTENSVQLNESDLSSNNPSARSECAPVLNHITSPTSSNIVKHNLPVMILKPRGENQKLLKSYHPHPQSVLKKSVNALSEPNNVNKNYKNLSHESSLNNRIEDLPQSHVLNVNNTQKSQTGESNVAPKDLPQPSSVTRNIVLHVKELPRESQVNTAPSNQDNANCSTTNNFHSNNARNANESEEFSPIITSVVSLSQTPTEKNGRDSMDHSAFGENNSASTSKDSNQNLDSNLKNTESSLSTSSQALTCSERLRRFADKQNCTNDGKSKNRCNVTTTGGLTFSERVRLLSNRRNSTKDGKSNNPCNITTTGDLISKVISKVFSTDKNSVPFNSSSTSSAASGSSLNADTTKNVHENDERTISDDNLSGTKSTCSTVTASTVDDADNNNNNNNDDDDDDEDDDVIWVADLVNEAPSSRPAQSTSSVTASNNDVDTNSSNAVIQSRLETMCSFNDCTNHNKPLLAGTKLMVCSVCRRVGYCSGTCQKQDWYFNHRQSCMKNQK